VIQKEINKVDHLVLLVGGNPLPNYVAGKLLVTTPEGIRLVYTSQTEAIAKQLAKLLGMDADDEAFKRHNKCLNHDQMPKAIYEAVKQLLDGFVTGSIGLNYTGGTKLMAAHAHRAARAHQRKVQCSYLDARTLSLIIDEGVESGADLIQPINEDAAVALQVHTLMELHGTELQRDRYGNYTFQNLKTSTPTQPTLEDDLARAILCSDVPGWIKWTARNFRVCDSDKLTFKLRDKKDLAAVSMTEVPEEIYAPLSGNVSREGTLKDWAKALGYTKQDEVNKAAKWLEGGWLEISAASLFKDIDQTRQAALTDLGINYTAAVPNFEFDVAATRGYRLFALSCTTSSDAGLCKSKLFEAFHRAGQMGGDEARVALLCGLDDKQAKDLLSNFRREFYGAEGAVHVFAIAELEEATSDPESEKRKVFINWLNGRVYDLKDNQWKVP
jgi:hypothetical protein